MTNVELPPSLRNARCESVWSKDLRFFNFPRVDGRVQSELAIVGAGFTGLWAAILAKQENPNRDVVVVESRVIGFGASSRNGGFISESLTHGHAHGIALWPKEMPTLVKLGKANFADIQQFVSDLNADVQLSPCGKSAIATRPHQVAQLQASVELHQAFGEDASFQTQEQIQADVHSPSFLAAMRIRTGGGLVHPTKLLNALVENAIKLGVQFFENSQVTHISEAENNVLVQTTEGQVVAKQVILATNGYRPLTASSRRRVLPIYDHVLATQQLTDVQLDSIGWKESQGLTDSGNQFHYFRKTSDNRILWGGYDANYYFGSSRDDSHEHNHASHSLLARQFVDTFPSLANVQFDYMWAGLIDSTSRFTPTYELSRSTRIGSVVGFTGLGVGASRFGAQVILDLLAGRDTERTNLEMVKKKPIAFPPEPLRSLLVDVTKRSLANEDVDGKRNLLLKTFDQFGVGFNS